MPVTFYSSVVILQGGG